MISAVAEKGALQTIKRHIDMEATAAGFWESFPCHADTSRTSNKTCPVRLCQGLPDSALLEVEAVASDF